MKFYREKFRELRKNLRWTSKALSEASNISKESISKWENGQRTPSAKSVYSLAKTIGVRVSEISDFEDLYPKSESKVSEIITTYSINLLDLMKNEGDLHLDNILTSLKSINSNMKRLSGILKTILLNVNNIIYIKDNDQKYVLTSKAFLDNSSLKVDFVSKGKMDKDFFTNEEAAFNTKEDEQVFATGNPIINVERYIPGSRKKKWGIFSKIPILDEENKIKGLICVIVDITERKKKEKYSKILEYAIAQTKTTIWVGIGIDTSDSMFLCKDIIYWNRSEKDDIFWGNINPNSYPTIKKQDIWYNSISEKTRAEFMNIKRKFNFPTTSFYTVTSPFNKQKIKVMERVYFDKENEMFVGLITLV